MTIINPELDQWDWAKQWQWKLLLSAFPPPVSLFPPPHVSYPSPPAPVSLLFYQPSGWLMPINLNMGLFSMMWVVYPLFGLRWTKFKYCVAVEPTIGIRATIYVLTFFLVIHMRRPETLPSRVKTVDNINKDDEFLPSDCLDSYVFYLY